MIKNKKKSNQSAEFNEKMSNMLSSRNLALNNEFENLVDEENLFWDLDEIKQEIEFTEEKNLVKIELEKLKKVTSRVFRTNFKENSTISKRISIEERKEYV